MKVNYFYMDFDINQKHGIEDLLNKARMYSDIDTIKLLETILLDRYAMIDHSNKEYSRGYKAGRKKGREDNLKKENDE